MRGVIVGGVVGVVLGVLGHIAIADEAPSAPREAQSLGEVRRELAQLTAAVAQGRGGRCDVDSAAIAQAVRAAVDGAPVGQVAEVLEAESRGEASDAESGAEARQPTAFDSAAYDRALAIIERGEATGVWGPAEVDDFQQDLLRMAPEDQIAATRELTLALNSGRFEIADGLLAPF